ncbi:MAG: glycosyltransferase [Bacillota bacterium]|nr:glycosyltransferase [Bacillota bacterium]
MSKVSVIMAAYNGEETIKESIDSILRQTHEALELIVVDDGSTDNTVSIVTSISDDRVLLLQCKNSGSPAAPRNAGIKKATGDFITFCDQDDLWYPKKIEKQLKAYEHVKHLSDVGIVFSSANLIDEAGKKVDENVTKFSGFLPADKAHNKMLGGDYIIACSALVPKSTMDEVGLLDEALVGVDDYDLWLRITENYGVFAIPEKLCAWRQSPNSLSMNKVTQYVRTEAVFAKLGDKTAEIRVGHGKNMLRILLASLLAKDYETAREYLEKIKNYPLSVKAKSIVGMTNISPVVGHLYVLFLRKLGKVSL